MSFLTKLLVICFMGLSSCVTRITARRCSFAIQCRCSDLSTFVQCSHSDLVNIPKFPCNVTTVDLSHNEIAQIEERHFVQNTYLRILDLSFNKIKKVMKESFVGLKHLSELKLNNNKITVCNEDAFANLPSLTFLDIKHTNINITRLSSHKMPPLTVLKADLLLDNKHSKLPQFLSNIKMLDVSGLSGKCRMNTITPTLFKHLAAVEYLDISKCQINTIYKGSIRMMTSLSTLDVSNNMCLRFSGLTNISQDLPYTAIKNLKANQIYKPFVLNTEIFAETLRPLNRTNITEIHIESNRVQLIETGAIQYLPATIKMLAISDNQFSYGEYLFELQNMQFEIINASNLFKPHNPNFPNETCDRQQEENFSTKKRLLTQYSHLEQNIRINIPENLKMIIYRNCRLRYAIPAFNVSENKIEHFDGGNNLFFAWIGPVLIFHNAKYMDLSYNFCSNVSIVFFQSVPNLEVLNIEGNLLGFIFPEDVQGNILQHIQKVERINMARNRIPYLPKLFFREQKSITYLNLANNMLEDVHFDLDHMTLMSYLDLSKNRLQYLSESTRKQLDNIATKTSNITVDLSDNNLKCTCETIKFIKWLGTTNVHLFNGKTYTCKQSNGETLSLGKPVRMYETLEKNCTSYIPLIMTVVAFCILFITVLSLGLAYRNRWKLRYMYYMIKIRFTKSPDEHIAVEKIYSYDAFISYEDGDRAFVHHILLKKLEHDAGMKLCIHKRDFLPGREIAENITSAIHDSRKVIVIMSPNYIKSYWCMFEFNMAKVESIYSRNKENILFLVFLHQVPTNELPLNVLELVQTQSYIEYPRDEFGNTLFWEKLKEILS